MSKSGIRRKHDENATQLHRRSCSASHPYKEGPSGRANGRATHNAYKERYQGPHVRGNGASMQDAPEDKDKIPRINHPTVDAH